MIASGARVLLVGIGGLGCPAAIALVDAGIGALGIADDDAVDATNLHRQILFDEADIDAPKLDAAARALTERATTRGRALEVILHRTRLLPSNAVAMVAGYDLVVEGSDNFATKFLVADACALARVAVVHAAAVRWHGTALAVGPRGRPCYRCLFEDAPSGDAPSCADAGVVGPMVGVVGALQADLALLLLEGRDVDGELVTFDGKDDAFRRRRVSPRASCSLCGTAPVIRSIEVDRYTPRAAPSCAL
jgi:molybdopterin/thiamine biosynthesis adenylyltransferase